MKKSCVVPMVFLVLVIITTTWSEQLSRSFEFRYFDDNPAANGQTDFKGRTAVFDTDQRIEFLSRYAEYAGHFFNNPKLNSRAVSESRVNAAVRNLKPQPLPKIRKVIPLERWRWIARKQGKGQDEIKAISEWSQLEGVKTRGGRLIFDGDRPKPQCTFPAQTWRFFIQFKAEPPTANQEQVFSLLSSNLSPVVTFGFGKDGHFFYYSGRQRHRLPESYGARVPYIFRVEVDLANNWYNLYIDDSLEARTVKLQSGKKVNQVSVFSVEGTAGLALDNIWGVGYLPGDDVRLNNYTINTFIDGDLQTKPPDDNWYSVDYKDTKWRRMHKLPLVIGGERNAGRDIYMRKVEYVYGRERAVLNVEALDPGGEVYINGKIVAKLNREPVRLDITKYVKKDNENLIAVKVNHAPKDYYIPDGHTPDDLYWGWFAARMSLELTAKTFIDDVFVYAKSVSNPACIQTRIAIKNEDTEPFEGNVLVNFYPWYPQEGSVPAATAKFPVVIKKNAEYIFDEIISVPEPKLWSFRNPNLYRVEVVLQDKADRAVDDYVVTTGIRTISQADGTFRINGKPEMLNGALIMQFFPPLDVIAAWHRCAPEDWISRHILMIKKLNGNAIRHHQPSCAYSDPRYAEYGDQLGVMYVWVPTGWNRKQWTQGGKTWLGRETLQQQVAEFVGNVKQLRNHPSIIVWELFNEFNKGVTKEETDKLFETFYHPIHAADPSRLFQPLKGYYRDEPMVAKGKQDSVIGYGKEWSELRKWPTRQKELLDSKDKAYFVFEHGEVTGQPNWGGLEGKPWYHIHSYEWDYDQGSIGRKLTFEQWKESQAWQALAGYNMSKKMRIYDVDGMLWCCLRGGGNSVTYRKPLIDYFGRAKLAFYTLQMAYQDVLAGSNDVDIVYGTKDVISPVIMNLGDARQAKLRILVRDMKRQTLDSKVYPNVQLPAGRTVTTLPDFKPTFPSKGYYAIEYLVSTSQ